MGLCIAVLVRNARFLFFFHISALLVLFVHGIGDSSATQQMQEVIQSSLDILSDSAITCSRETSSWRGPIKAVCMARAMADVSRNQRSKGDALA